MVAPTNFLQWNPDGNNQLTDGDYLSNTSRVNGAITGIFESPLANKIFYQTSTLVVALATTMVNKGYEMQDGNLSFLITALSNLLTRADIGTGVGSVCAGNDSRLNQPGMNMWFYANVAPTGWTLLTGVSDAILSVKGGTSAYNVSGGQQAGTWAQPNHLHDLAHGHTQNAHNHQIYDYVSSPASQVYNSSGNLVNMTRNTGGSNIGWVVQVDGEPDYVLPFDAYTSNSTPTINNASGNTGASSTANTYRPLANVGIICTKN